MRRYVAVNVMSTHVLTAHCRISLLQAIIKVKVKFTCQRHDTMMPRCLKCNCLCKALIEGSESLLILENSHHSSNFEKRFENSKHSYSEISRIFSNCRSNFRWNVRIRIQFRNLENIEIIALWKNSSKVRRYFVSLKIAGFH